MLPSLALYLLVSRYAMLIMSSYITSSFNLITHQLDNAISIVYAQRVDEIYFIIST